MNFTSKRINLTGILLLLGFVAVAAGLFSKVPARSRESKSPAGNCASGASCCGGAVMNVTLPPGHPPVPGFTTNSGCDHSSGTGTNLAK